MLLGSFLEISFSKLRPLDLTEFSSGFSPLNQNPHTEFEQTEWRSCEDSQILALDFHSVIDVENPEFLEWQRFPPLALLNAITA